MVAVLVAVSMATSLTPSAAFANENAEGTAADQPTFVASSYAVSGDACVSDSQAGTEYAPDEQGAGAAGADGVAGDADDASTVSDAPVDEAPSGDSSNAEEVNSEASASATPVASEQGEPKAAAASATTLSSVARVCIQDTKDENNSYSTTSGPLKAGKTLWANMYDEDEDDLYGSSYSVSNPGTWTYTWLAGTTRASSNVADYTEVVGHEQSLTVTAAMEGKYFICKVTVDGKDYYGPSVSSGSGINANYIPGPVLGAGQMELNSVKLNSDTPSIGDTLTATPYISYYQEAPADAKVTYPWSASTSQYSGFTKIEGETGATLVVGDDLEGKYIRVEANAGVNTVNKTTSSKVKQAGAVELSAVSIVNTKDNTSVFAVGDTAKARAKEKGGAYGAFVDASKLNYQWQCSDTKSGTYADIVGATGETLELTDALGGKYLKCKVSSKIGSSSMANNTGALVAATGSINVTSVTMSPTSGKVEVGSTITATAKAGSTDVTADSHVTWQWYKGTSNTASKCDTPIKGETGNTLTVTAALKGYYVVAKANGGYGEQKPYYAVGPVSVAGQVELYDVQFEGSPATNGVHVGDTLKTKVRKKDGSRYNYIDRTDNVTYQWQYANSSSSYDSAYTDIPGATKATYTVDAAYAGKYLRVKVTSENTVSSTQKKSSYGGTQSVAPLGPVTLKGQYKLAGIELADKNVTLSVGSKITPSVQVPGSWSGSTKDVPDDAELTMAWYAKGEGDADWTELTDGINKTDGSLTISAALVGKRIKVTASALDNTVEWVSSDSVTAAGEYNLLRVTTTPQINSESTHLVSGDSVKATAQAKRADGSTTNGIDVTGQATVAWYAADDAKAPAADWTLLSDMSGAAATVSASAAGKYLKAVATSGSSTVELVSANKVIAAGSLEAAVQKLNDANKQIAVDYSAKGGNVNDVLKAQLADLGFTDIDVKVSEGGVAFKAEDAKATVGISDAQDKTNGNVTFFFIDPNNYTGYNIDGLRNADVAFELSRDGKTEYYLPNKSVQVAWDETKLQDLLDGAAESLQIGYASGESADGVTQNVTLPYKAGSAKKFSVEWTSSDTERLFVSGYSWEDKTGKVSRASSDRDVTLTAKVTVTSGDIKLAGSHDFVVTVKGDPEKVNADKKALQEKVNAAFTYDNIKYSGTDVVANKDGLTGDLQMPFPKAIGVDGKYYSVVYSASTDNVTFNGYKGTVYQPLPGESAAVTKITVTVTDKSNKEVTASKTLDYVITPQDQTDLNNELALMEQAKAGYAAAILNGQDASAVTSNMHAFQKAYLDAEGNLTWSYGMDTSNAAGNGIVPVDLPGYDAMSGQGWRLFKTSNTAVVSAENLLVTQPEFNTKVIISSSLTSEKYARYAERYPDNATYAKLANQAVSATITVLGTTGQVSPEVNVTCSVIGVDAAGNQQAWASAQSYTVKRGTNAADVTLGLFKDAGLSADYDPDAAYGFYLKSITSPFDKTQKLGYDQATGKYWQLYVNGVSSNAGASGTTLEEGDSIVWAYSAHGDPAPTDELSVTCEVIGRDKDGNQQTWAQPTTLTVKDGSNAGELSEQLFKKAGLKAKIKTEGWWFLDALTSPFDAGNTLQTTDGYTEYWQFFVNGKLANVGAGDYELKAGDKISWVYGSYPATVPGQISVSMEVIGKWDGKYERWTNASQQTFVEGTTLREASDSYLTACGFEPKFMSLKGDDWTLVSMKNPFNGIDQTLSWVPFVNGKRADEGRIEELHSGDKVVWVFSPEGDTVPNPDEVTVDPDAERPADWTADWDGKSNAVTDAATPTGTAAAEWTFDWKKFAGDGYANASEPIVVNGFVYLAVNNRLLKIDSATGKVLAAANLKSSISYTSRPVYAKGLIIVPLNGGAVQALTADELATVWLTDAVSGDAQASTTIAIDGNYAYVGTSDVPKMNVYNNGHLICINILTGVVSWEHVNRDEGYYWTGATSVDGVTVVPTSAGTVEVLNSNGDLVGSCNVGSIVNSTVVASGSSLYLVSRDGKLHVLELEKNGAWGAVSGIKETKTVDLGLTGSACVPTLQDSKLFIGGEVKGGSALAIVDIASLKTQLITTADGSALPAGGIKGAPLVSQQVSGTYVYFTVNYGGTTDYVNYTSGGGTYCYKLDDAEASAIYTAAGHNNFCDSPIASDTNGNLYYINDSGTLFKLSSGLKITFSTGAGSSVLSDSVMNGGKVSRPADPTREGYTFGGWFADEACTQAYDFDAQVTGPLTLYAKWNEKPAVDNNNGGSDNNGAPNNSSNGAGASNAGSVAPAAMPISAASNETAGDGSDVNAKSDESASSKDEKSSSDKATARSSSKAENDGVTKSAAAADNGASSTESAPIWPYIVLAVGVAGLAAATVWFVVARRKRDGDE